MKAALLFHGEAVEQYGHNLNALLAKIGRTEAGEHIPRKLQLPRTSARGREAWSNKTVDQYVEYMNIFGSPDNRYAFEGLGINGPVLHALDFTCLHLRSGLNTQNLLSQNLYTYRNQGRTTIKKGKPAPLWMIDRHLPLERLFLKSYQVG